MINRRVIIGIILFIIGGLVVFTFANPGPSEEPTPINQEQTELEKQIEEATAAVEKAETSRLQVDVDNAYTLVNALPNGTTKDELLGRLNDLQEQIDLANQIVVATTAVEVAETTKSQTDVTSARNLVNNLPEGTVKTDLLARLDVVQDEIDLRNQIAAATAAVVLAEETETQVNVNSARTLVNALPDGTVKTGLIERLNAVQAIIDLRNQIAAATAAVTLAEETETQVNVNSARTLVNALPEGTEKTGLIGRLNAVQAIIDLRNQIAAATAAVTLAEETETQVNVDSAKTLVNALPDSATKTGLIERLNAVQAIIDLRNQIAAATAAVVKAEDTETQDDVDAALLLVNALPEGTEKTDLLSRLTTVQSVIDLKNAKENAIANLEQYVIDLGITNYYELDWSQIQSLKNAGITAINEALTITDVQDKLNAAKSNIDAVLTILEQSIQNALEELAAYFGAIVPSDYSEVNYQLIINYNNEGIAAINASLTTTEVDEALTNAKNNIDSVKTKAEELAIAKENARDEFYTYLSTKYWIDYYVTDWNKLENYRDNGFAAIESATTIDEVNQALIDAKNNIDSVKTIAVHLFEAYRNMKANMFSIYANSFKENDYRPNNWILANQAKANGIAAINSATTYDEVNAAYDNAFTEFDAVTRLTLQEKMAINAVVNYENAPWYFKKAAKKIAENLVNNLADSELKTELLGRLA